MELALNPDMAEDEMPMDPSHPTVEIHRALVKPHVREAWATGVVWTHT